MVQSLANGEDDMNVSSNRNYYFTEDGLILVMFMWIIEKHY